MMLRKMLNLSLCTLLCACDGLPVKQSSSTQITIIQSAKPTESSARESTTKATVKVDVSEFEARYKAEGQNAQKVTELWFESLYLYLEESTRLKGQAQLDLLFEQENWKTASTTATFRERTQSKPYIFYSYLKGSNPDNGYQADTNTQNLMFDREDPLSENLVKVYLNSSGADSPRGLRLRKNADTNLWQINEFSSIYVDIRAPK